MNSQDKYYLDNENKSYFKKLNNTLTPIQAINILNKMYISIGDKNEIEEEYELLKNWIRSK